MATLLTHFPFVVNYAANNIVLNMRNIKLQLRRKLLTEVLRARVIIFNQKDVYIATSDKLYKCSEDKSISLLYEQPGIIGVEYLVLENNICIATDVGEVIILNPQTGDTKEGTFCSVGIECMSWNPDQDVVVFITREHHVVVMNCTYDSIAEHDLLNCEDNRNFIKVGWGKKETQFHGSEGKFSSKKINDFQSLENLSKLPRTVAITWRADGEFFAVSFVSEFFGRMFKIFDREGNLTYISEPQNGLYPPISWRPSGTWIALAQQLSNKSTISLFEKNGLRHRELVLPFQLNDQPVVSIQWSTDSTILALETQTRHSQKSSLWLYTINNYHWYLKQLLSFNESISSFRWDTRINEEKTLHVFLQDGCYFIHRWQFTVDNVECRGIVGVIDGPHLLLSDFSNAIIPPPMCTTKIMIEENINACSFIINKKDELQLVLLDANKNLHIFKSPIDAPLNLVRDQQQFTWNEKQLQCLELANITWFTEDCLLTTISQGENTEVLFITFNIVSGECCIESKLVVLGTVCALKVNNREQFIVQTDDGNIQILSLSADFGLCSLKLYSKLDCLVDQLLGYKCRQDVGGIIALQVNGCLNIDKHFIAEGVTSICLVGSYLMYTSLNRLFFIRLIDRLIVAERRIERGSKLITAIVSDARTIFQMPRGNLEAIYPRILSLEIVGKLLDNQQYRVAIDMLRKQRINLNIVCDHNLCTFIDHLEIFLNDVQNIHWLNLFINDLQNKDFTCTIYSTNYINNKRNYPHDFNTIENKIEYICERLCLYMEQRNDPRFQLPIITCYVKLGKLEKALLLIWNLKQLEDTMQKLNDASDEALKYLLYLVDVNELYNIALGTYEIGLVLFIAEKSHKDPKEFLPFLNELKTHQLNYRKFKIDDFLKRYEKALENIAHCQSEEYFEEALIFVQRHKIYQKALKVYDSQPTYSKRICIAFADYLRANGKFDNASIMYERGGNLSQAVLSAKHVMDWQRVLALTYENNGLEQVASVALSMVPALLDSGHYIEAYELQKMYGHKAEEAFHCLLKGKLFLKAILEARMSMKQLIADLILPYLLNYWNVLENNISEDKDLFLKYKQRLFSIRNQHAKGEGDNGLNFNELREEFDLVSDTTSVHSSSRSAITSCTSKTFRSNKTRRKHERKVLSLKHGNPYEDIALIDALHTLIMKTVNQAQHIHDTCKALLELQLDDEAYSLQNHFKEIINLLEDSLDEIWLPETLSNQQFVNGYGYIRDEQRYALLEPYKRFKPKLNLRDWQHEILR